MSQIYNSILDTIGNTPIVKLNHCIDSTKHTFWAKLEYFNPGSSVKDRVGLAIINDAEKSGRLKPGGTIVEATSGNTGVGLAQAAVLKGYKCIFVMPDKISEEKRAILRAYGAEVIITPTNVAPEDARSYLSVSNRLSTEIPNAILGNQYHNPANVGAHLASTGPEIWEQTHGALDVFVAGAGTGGTISGVGQYLKSKKETVKIICADPIGSILADLYNHGKVIDPPQSYKIEGVGEDMLPENVHFNFIDGFEKVSDKEAFEMTRKIMSSEAICVGPSSAMALVGAIKYSQKLVNPSNILVLFPDNGRAYLSKAFNDEWMKQNIYCGEL
jgi:cystathionine beta-synthase